MLILLLLAVGGFGTLNASRLAADLDASAQVDLHRVDLAGALGFNAGIVARASREMLLLDAAGPLKKQRALLMKALQDSDEQLQRLVALGSEPQTEQPLAKLKESKELFGKAVAHYLEKIDAGNPDDAREALLIGLRPVQAGYEQALQALTTAVRERASARAAEGQSSARTGMAWLVLAAAGVLLAVAAIDATGAVTQVTIVDAAPAKAKVFNEAATEALKQRKFVATGKAETFELKLVFQQE